MINIGLILRYHILDMKGSKWWSALVLRDIVIYFLIFGQMLIEYKTWNNKLYKWRQELVFEQRFNAQNDQSETFIRKNIQSMIEDIANQGDNAMEDEAII